MWSTSRCLRSTRSLRRAVSQLEPATAPGSLADLSTLTCAEQIGAVESVKAASDIFAPVSGRIAEVNQELDGQPGLLNKSPEQDGQSTSLIVPRTCMPWWCHCGRRGQGMAVVACLLMWGWVRRAGLPLAAASAMTTRRTRLAPQPRWPAQGSTPPQPCQPPIRPVKAQQARTDTLHSFSRRLARQN